MTEPDHFQWVREHLPNMSADARAKFLERNPQMRGAGWDDCLERLLDSDSHLDITEPIHEIFDATGPYNPRLVSAVALTLLYADRDFAVTFTNEQRAEAVAVVINAPEASNGSD